MARASRESECCWVNVLQQQHVVQNDTGFVLVNFFWAVLRCKEPPDSIERLR